MPGRLLKREDSIICLARALFRLTAPHLTSSFPSHELIAQLTLHKKSSALLKLKFQIHREEPLERVCHLLPLFSCTGNVKPWTDYAEEYLRKTLDLDLICRCLHIYGLQSMASMLGPAIIPAFSIVSKKWSCQTSSPISRLIHCHIPGLRLIQPTPWKYKHLSIICFAISDEIYNN